MKMILGRKLNMTQTHTESGMVVPVTVIKAGPCAVSQVKTREHDGYDAIQLMFGEKKKAHKPEKGHVAGLPGITEGRGAAYIKELRTPTPIIMAARGAVVTVASFTSGDRISVTGCSKGRGFAGVVKRHHFHGHPTTHGHKDQERMPGSIGSGGVQHVFRGQRMAGRMGNEQVTVHGLEIITIDNEQGLLFVKGAVPGSRNGLLVIVARDGEMTFEQGLGSRVQGSEIDSVSEEIVFEQTTEQTTEAPPLNPVP